MVGRRKGPSLVELTALALLTQGPRHAWDLHRFIVDTHKDFVTGLPRSLYHAMNRLAGDGLVAPVETTREGNRPERTVYEITEDGRAFLATQLRQLLETPGRDTEPFVASLSLFGCLSETDVSRALRTRAAVLEGQTRSAEQTIAGLTETGLPRVLLLELDYERSRADAELAWVRALIADIDAGQITWTGSLPEFP
ncbi:MAG TPA: PadR family transcriptional regulator [Stackebrandtia sp.]|jgi:DNA-binding PadR family transcriptional regulator|uniref:PadR family transcriptional regulator n=1 Tax=Stackebrandtia sp. TaxID=2023065 RepID=UPI002D3F144F|nr:PadR family transcriptional regulator [Stackebrandtia sp.]HZE39613.1 PadR family transcriptional regulator [Stackebrandtia sp.]